MANTIFSDAWFRVSGLRVALLPSVEVQTQVHRGRQWHVLQDTYTQRYFRASEQACNFIRQLTLDRTVEEVWEDFVNKHPEDAPSQEEVIQLLSQLHLSNLLYSLEKADNEAIVARYKKQKNKELQGKLASFLFLRVPLWNPNPWLNSIQGLVRLTTGWGAGAVWLAMLIAGGLTMFENRQALADQTQGALSISNLPWLYVCLSVLKLFHEAGHGFVCKRFGGEVRTFGVMFLLLTPLPYVDASSSWGFANRWQRIYVSFAGMAVEFFFAALGALVWANTGPGLTNSLAFNVMLIGSLSSLLFNGNPLLRFDAYYMLSDYAEIPNLYQKSQQQWKYFGNRHILGTVNAHSLATDAREWLWLTLYGLLSFIYLMMVTLGISLFLMDQSLALGLLVLGMTLFSRFLNPAYQLLKHLRSVQTQGNRRRAVINTMAIVLLIVGTLGFLPVSHGVRATGVLQANQSSSQYLQLAARLEKLHVSHGDKVRQGQLLASLASEDLSEELRVTELGLTEARVHFQQALYRAPHELASVRKQMESLSARRQELLSFQSKLWIHADQDGEWVAPELHQMQGSWLPKGHLMGEIIDRSHFRFLAVIQQEQADYLFKQDFLATELRLVGQSDVNIRIDKVDIIPFQSQTLPSVALGWMGGGDIPVNTNDPAADKALDSFYTLYGQVPVNAGDFTRLHGLSGTVRFSLPPQSLFVQAYRSLQQTAQKRYAL